MEWQQETAATGKTTKDSRKNPKPTKEGRKKPKPSKVSVVRIKYTDPDATDDSSSDETTSSSPKQIIHEVYKKATSSKYPGARLRKWGNWCAEIRNPITKRRQWLGTFSTAQEASRVYLEKKKEFATEGSSFHEIAASAAPKQMKQNKLKIPRYLFKEMVC